MRILITGATGFIGHHLVERLTAAHDVYALVRQVPLTPPPFSSIWWVPGVCSPMRQRPVSVSLSTLRQAASMDAAVGCRQLASGYQPTANSSAFHRDRCLSL
ncbi:MAG: NAD(P)-dependent oxidoreductase [Caldilineaceae bacterium]